MKLITYELRKVLKNKKLLVFLFLLLLFNIFTFLFAQQNTAPYMYRNYYKQFQKVIKDITYDSPKEGIQKLQKFQDLTADYQVHDAYAQKIYTKKDVEQYHQSIEEKYGKKELELAEKQNENLTMLQSQAYCYYSGKEMEQLQYQMDYAKFQKQVKKEPTDVLPFLKNRNFIERDQKKTYNAYKKLGTVTLKNGNLFTAKKYLNYKYDTIFLIGVVLLLSIGIFRPDQQKKMTAFLKTHKKGRSPLLRAKLLSLGILVFGCTLLMEFVIFFTSLFLYGSFDGSMPIQTLNNFRNCTLPWNLAQFIGAGILAKCIFSCIFGSLLAALLLRFEKNRTVYAITLLLLALEWSLYTTLLSNGTFSIFKFANIFQGFYAFRLLGIYENCNVFSFAINKFMIFCFFAAILWIGSMLFASRFWKVTRESKEKKTKTMQKPKRIGKISLGRSVLRIHFLHEKRYLLCIGLLCYGIYCACFQSVFASTMLTTLTQSNYENWIDKYQGELTNQKIKSIENDKKKYDKLWDRVAELSSKDKLSLKEKAELDALDTQTGVPYDAFCEFLDQYETIKARKNAGKDAKLLNNYCWNRPFTGFAKELKNMGIACIFCILLCAGLFENKNNMNALLETTMNGRKRLYRRKYLLGIGFAVMSWACCILPEFFRFIRTKPDNNWTAAIGNLSLFQNSSYEVPIYVAIAGIYLTQLFLCILCSLVVMYFVEHTNSSFLVMTITSISILIILALLYHNNAGVINTWLPHGKQPLLPCFIECSVCTALGLLIILHWEKEWNYRWKRK